jgi:hypothetical protein
MFTDGQLWDIGFTVQVVAGAAIEAVPAQTPETATEAP